MERYFLAFTRISQVTSRIFDVLIRFVLHQGRAADLKYVEGAARMIADVAVGHKIVVEKSTVPVRAAESISNILQANLRESVSYQVIMIRFA